MKSDLTSSKASTTSELSENEAVRLAQEGNSEGFERLYQKLYARLANLYRASDKVEIDDNYLLAAAANVLKTDSDFSAAIALNFRIALVNVFFAGILAGIEVTLHDGLRVPVEVLSEDAQLRPRRARVEGCAGSCRHSLSLRPCQRSR